MIDTTHFSKTPFTSYSTTRIRNLNWEATSKFKTFTGINVDQIHPCWLGQVSDDALEAYADLILALERTMCWPEGLLLRGAVHRGAATSLGSSSIHVGAGRGI